MKMDSNYYEQKANEYLNKLVTDSSAAEGAVKIAHVYATLAIASAMVEHAYLINPTA